MVYRRSRSRESFGEYLSHVVSFKSCEQARIRLITESVYVPVLPKSATVYIESHDLFVRVRVSIFNLLLIV